ncbi:MAG: hypothetical protein OXR66_07445 [Candidatus Woesearchaeota archaeon]|nr:hypothetical protein [Candidatus Woesearchaeota archaeon]
MIPDSPSIKLACCFENFPQKLTVFVKNEQVEKILENKISEFATKQNVEERAIKNYIKRKRYPISLLKHFPTNILKEIWNREPVLFSKWKKVKVPTKLTPKLAYFVGYLQGDGSIESNKKRIDFSDEYKSQIERMNELSKELFLIGGKICEKRSALSKKPCYRLDIGSKVLNAYLHIVFSINRGVKKDLQIPPVMKRNKVILKWYLAGLYDADGTLPKNPKTCKQAFVDITMKDRAFIEDINKQLARFHIKTLPIYCRKAKYPGSDKISTTWEIRIRRREMIQKFLRRVGFAHPNKRVRMQALLDP